VLCRWGVLQDNHQLCYNLISGRHAPGILFSDHLALLFKLKTARPPLKVDCVSFRKLRSIDKDAFKDDICNSELFQMNTDDPDELLPYLTIPCVPCWIVTLLLSIRILPFDLVFHGLMTRLSWLNDKGGKLKGNGELLKHISIYCLTVP